MQIVGLLTSDLVADMPNSGLLVGIQHEWKKAKAISTTEDKTEALG
jgi:hypothetical protein